VEDMQLGIDLALGGHPPLFYPEAKVTSTLPQQGEAATSQRTRWEHGHLQTLFTQVPKLIKASLQQKRFDLLTLALDLGVPPLSLLVMLWGVSTTCALTVAMVGLTWTPALILAGGGLLMTVAIVVSWAKFGRDTIPVSTLWKVPVYLLWKIPLYLAFIFKPQKQWVRTERDNPKSATS
jgi:cellulose synthase/poly-beta-1,6-N-acetylglucosamine synthase-like glycosyltransferase